MKKKVITFVASLAILAGGVFGYLAIASPTEAASFGNCKRDNDNNAIIKNGACSTDELSKKYKENKTKDLPAIFKHYNVPTNFSSAKKGEVRKNGDVVVDGKVVATGAKSVGRQNIGNSSKVTIGGKTFYERKTSTSFATNSIQAFVFFDKNGEFQSAVLTSCANPVTAKPKPKVAYKCDNLTSQKIDRTRHELEVKTSQHRATFQSVTFNVYDKSGKKIDSKKSNSKKYTYTQTTAGEYTVKAVVTFKTHDGKTVKSKEGDCVTKIVVEVEPCPYDPSLPKDDPKCFDPCPYNPDLPKDDPKCEEPKKPVYDCDSLTGKLIGEATDRTYNYTVEYTAENGAKLESVDFNFGDGNKQEGVTPSELDNVTHTYAKEGDYTTIATLKFNIDGNVKSVKCSTKITASPDKEEPCPENPDVPVGHDDCQPPKEEEPCEFDPNLPKDSKDCEAPEEPETPVAPVEEEKGKGEETPVEIPKTGAGSILGAFAGLGSIGAASYYYFASRRELLGKLMNR